MQMIPVLTLQLVATQVLYLLSFGNVMVVILTYGKDNNRAVFKKFFNTGAQPRGAE